MDFEWDEQKNAANRVKHSIDFLDAISIWNGPVLDPAASRKTGQEERHVALGTIGAEQFIIAVIYTVRDSARRIISARRARRNERATYQNITGQGR
ncbi:MAG: BrnT family toxin [Novosphingobium sp.]|nr:BrnT family toxin [Novosphingobium sp.]